MRDEIQAFRSLSFHESPEVTKGLIQNAALAVRVFRPRKALSAKTKAQLETVSLSDLSMAVLDCYDVPWKKTSEGFEVDAPIFVADVPERAEFRTYAQNLLMRLSGTHPPFSEQQGSLITGPVGCGKSKLTSLLALSVAATSLQPKPLLIHYECAGDQSNVLFTHIIAAGLLKAKLSTIDRLIEEPLTMARLRSITPKASVILFIDEVQRMFQPGDATITTALGPTTRSDALAGQISWMESKWPRSLLSGSASSLNNLFYRIDLAPSSVFPSKMPRSVNSTKFTRARTRRLESSSSLIPIVADFEREFQLSVRAASEPSLERDPDTGVPVQFSLRNRKWLQTEVRSLSDADAGDTLPDRNKALATNYLRRFLKSDVEDDNLLLFAAFVFSRGIPRVLKDLRGKDQAPIEGLQSFIPEEVRTLWCHMASFLLQRDEPGFQKKLEDTVREMKTLTYPTQVLTDVMNFEDLALFTIDIPDLVARIPGAAGSIPSDAMMVEFVDRGYILWDKERSRVSFASVADFVLTRLSVTADVREFHLLALLFNECGKEHERIAIGSLQQAANSRLSDPGVQSLLRRIGLLPNTLAETPWVLNEGARAFIDLCPLRRDVPTPFPSRPVFVSTIADAEGPPRGGSGKRTKIRKEKPSRTSPTDGADASEGVQGLKPESSTPDLLLSESSDFFHECLEQAFPTAKVEPNAEALELVRNPTVRKGTLAFTFATSGKEGRSRTVHEAFGLDPSQRSRPVIFKPAPDRFKLDWILVNPDESISVLQMKHGGSPIREKKAVVEVTAGATVLRSWLGHQGVKSWDTVPIRRVFWSTQPVEETKTVKIPPGVIAESAGVEWLDKFTIAPIWSAEVVQILFHCNKQDQWGVGGEARRASVDLLVQKSLPKLLLEAAQGCGAAVTTPSPSDESAEPQ